MWLIQISPIFALTSGFAWRRILGHESLMVRQENRWYMRDPLGSLYMKTWLTHHHQVLRIDMSKTEMARSSIFSCMKYQVCTYVFLGFNHFIYWSLLLLFPNTCTLSLPRARVNTPIFNPFFYYVYLLGKDNYMANLTDSAFGETAYPINTEFSSETKEKPKPLNVGYYHK